MGFGGSLDLWDENFLGNASKSWMPKWADWVHSYPILQPLDRGVLPVNLGVDSADGNECVTSKDWHAHSCGRGNVLGL